MITPFSADGAVDRDKLAKITDYLVTKELADSLILTGSTGGFYTMADDERVGVWETIREANHGRLPMLVGTGGASTQQAVKLTQKAGEMDFELAMVVAPYYCKPTQEGIYQHFRTVAKSTELPIMLYNIPLFTGVNLEAGTLRRLLEFDNIVAIKEEAGINPTQSTDFVLAAREVGRDDFTVYCGDDTMILQVLPQGGVGVVSGGSQVVGLLMRDIIKAYYADDNAKAHALYLKMYPFFKALTMNGRVSPFPLLHTAISITSGIDVGAPRLPLAPTTPDEERAMRRVLEEVLGVGKEVTA
jgi:4-hydroxy-tetrahydrodipicolinate synthase